MKSVCVKIIAVLVLAITSTQALDPIFDQEGTIYQKWVNKITQPKLSTNKSPQHHPVFGVMTQPTPDHKLSVFNHTQYVTEVYKEFLELGGSKGVPIKYDITDEELYPLLDQLNGVLFTGGGLVLIDSLTGEQHQYYQTSKKIYEYSKKLQAEKNEKFPLFGMCQGIQMLAMFASGDQPLLSEVFVANENRKIMWSVNNPKKDSRMFGSFDSESLHAIANEDLSYQMHELGITTETFNSHDNLKDFFKLVAIDYADDVEFITMIEAYDYPMYATTYHPEFHVLDFQTHNRISVVQNEKTEKIAWNYSKYLNNLGKQNSNYFKDPKELDKILLNNLPKGFYPLVSVVRVPAVGINY